MRASVLVATALLAAVNAAPVAEPVRTVFDVVEVFTTVYESAAAPAAATAAASSPARKKNWLWSIRQSQAAVPQQIAQTSAPAVVAVTTAAASPVAVVSSVVNPVQATQAAQSPQAGSGSSAPSSGYNAPNGDDYARRVVDHHNAHRANHSAPALSWDANLASIANQIANSCNYAHDLNTGGGGYGQNIAAGAPINNITSVITDLFYNGEMTHFASLYGQATPSNLDNESQFDAYGHFTQLVWKATTKVGCASVDCTGRGKGPKGLGNVGNTVSPIFTVCNYGPPGNYRNEFAKNVLPPQNQPSIDWSFKY